MIAAIGIVLFFGLAGWLLWAFAPLRRLTQDQFHMSPAWRDAEARRRRDGRP